MPNVLVEATMVKKSEKNQTRISKLAKLMALGVGGSNWLSVGPYPDALQT
jgi:hypothetical protein